METLDLQTDQRGESGFDDQGMGVVSVVRMKTLARPCFCTFCRSARKLVVGRGDLQTGRLEEPKSHMSWYGQILWLIAAWAAEIVLGLCTCVSTPDHNKHGHLARNCCVPGTS